MLWPVEIRVLMAHSLHQGATFFILFIEEILSLSGCIRVFKKHIFFLWGTEEEGSNAIILEQYHKNQSMILKLVDQGLKAISLSCCNGYRTHLRQVVCLHMTLFMLLTH